MNRMRSLTLSLVLVFVLISVLAVPAAAQGLKGSFYTTTSGCEAGVVSHFPSADAVYLASNGKLPDGAYWLRVTTPDGILLGSSSSAAARVMDGDFAQCYRLWDLLKKVSADSAGWDANPHPGGVFKVWLSADAGFTHSKTHTFKIAVKAQSQHDDADDRDCGDDDDDMDDNDDEVTPRKGKGRDGPGVDYAPPGLRSRLDRWFERLQEWMKKPRLGGFSYSF